MSDDKIKTFGSMKVQVFEGVLESPEENARLNELYKDRIPQKRSPEEEQERAKRQLLIFSSRRNSAGIMANGTPSKDAHIWELTMTDQDTMIPLPADVADSCYGTRKQSVIIWLHRLTCAASVDKVQPQIEIAPAPTQGTLVLLIPFADGSQRELTVNVPTEQVMSARSAPCEPLSAPALDAARWEGNVTFSCRD